MLASWRPGSEAAVADAEELIARPPLRSLLAQASQKDQTFNVISLPGFQSAGLIREAIRVYAPCAFGPPKSEVWLEISNTRDPKVELSLIRL